MPFYKGGYHCWYRIGGIWRYWAVLGGIGRYWAVLGGIWYLCVLCVMSAERLYTVVNIYQHNGHK